MERQERLNRIKQWQQTEEYALQYTTFLSAAHRLISLAEQKMPEIETLAEKIYGQTVRTVAAKQSWLHRGYYCPSRVYDLVVGNVKRGTLLKRLTARSKSYFLYGFDEKDRLLWSKHFYNNCHIKSEYLLHMGSSIYGFTIDLRGHLEAITEEVYENNRLVCYRYLLVVSRESAIEPVEMKQENYTYDSEGLLYCDWYRLHPAIFLLTHERVTFARKDGYLTQYWVDRIVGSTHQEVVEKSDIYDVLVERKA